MDFAFEIYFNSKVEIKNPRNSMKNENFAEMLLY